MKLLLRKYLLPYITLAFLKSLWWTWRVTIVEPKSLQERLFAGENFIMAHWHGDELPLLPLVTKYRFATMTSTSKDGELIDWVIKKLGGATSRGSSTRGAVGALKGLLRLIRNERRNASMAVDGPKGPIYKVKPGIFEISRISKTPIYWVSVTANKYFLFSKAWNKAFLPKPFAQVHIELHGPFPAVTSEMNPKDLNLAIDLENRLNAAKKIAQNYYDPSLGSCK